jgi:tetratricopeptide (TPR) repeat protein/tRNA A-37 threonylcarbamoyl transferase component Bud32
MGIDDSHLDGFLGAAFRPPEGESVLESIERLHGAGGSVLLRDNAEEDATPVLLRRDESHAAKDDSRYQVLGEIARGGIGVVYKGRDKDLNRDIALKVLRAEFIDRDDVIQRFIEEAQIGGQLQHPGIVPIYGIGLQHDGRPCFAMKLIKGQTLAELLASNRGGIDLLVVFEQVAQTMAYVHSRGVIHRDLKPANIMIGAFGEVQVVDWGFAKVLGHAEPARPEQTMIATVRSAEKGSQSVAGSVMGTPAYMPPEQAMGRIEDLDERSDVFALGAILCEILTGKAPYTGETKDQIIAATQCLLEDAHERLDAADAADELKDLVRDCLKPKMGDRPQSARIVAERTSDHFATVEDRARESELEAITAETDAAAERKGRKRALVMAAVAFVAVVTVGGGLLVWKRDRDGRVEKAAPLIAAAMREATGAEGKQDWDAAVGAARRAVDTATSEGVDAGPARELRARLAEQKSVADAKAAVREENDRFLAMLEGIRARRGQPVRADEDGAIPDNASTEAAYAAAFKQRFGTLEAGEKVMAASRHREAFAAHLGLWCMVRKTRLKRPGWEPIDRLARRLDPSHADVRDALIRDDREALLEIARERDDLPLLLASLVGAALDDGNRATAAVAFLKRQHLRAPQDFWINYRLAAAATRAKEDELALQHATAAVAVRPDNKYGWNAVGWSLLRKGDPDGAIVAFRRSLQIDPQYAGAAANIGNALGDKGDVDGAIAQYRRALAIDPDAAATHFNLGVTLWNSGDVDGALAAYRRSLELDPEFVPSIGNTGRILLERGDLEGAVKRFERVLELDPECATAYVNLGAAYKGMGRYVAAIAASRRAIDLDPGQGRAYNNLGNALYAKRDLAGAEAAYRRAIELDPQNALAHVNFGVLLESKREHERSAESCRRAIALDPDLGIAHVNLATALTAMGDRDGALAAMQEALAVDPENPLVHRASGAARRRAGDLDGALEAYRRALALDPRDARAHGGIGEVLTAKRDHAEAFVAFRRAFELGLRDARTYINFGNLLLESGDAAGAAQRYRRGVELDPNLPEGHSNLGAALRVAGDPAGAVEACRRALALDPGYASAHFNMAQALLEQGKHADAIAAFRRTIELEPANHKNHFHLGVALARSKDHAGAIVAYRRCLALHPTHSMAHNNLGTSLLKSGDREGALAAVRRALQLDPGNKLANNNMRIMLARQYGKQLVKVLDGAAPPAAADERLSFAELCYRTSRPGDAVRFYLLAFEADPTLMAANSYNAGCAAAQAGKAHRRQALTWLRAHLDWLKGQGSKVAARWLERWKFDDALNDVDPEMGGDLGPEWRKLWADMHELRKRAGGAK